MIRTLHLVLFFGQLFLLPVLGLAQQLHSAIMPKTDMGKLQQIATEQNQKYTLQHERVLELAKKHNWVINQTQSNGSFISLQGVTEAGRPIYYETHNNEASAITTNTNRVWLGGTAGLNLSGSNPILAGKLGIWDGGAVRKTHQELNGRIVNRDGATALNDHATHVAGTMIARGIYPAAKGMSHGAVDLQAWNFNNDGSEISGAASGLLVSNHSYGVVAGWRLIGSNWYWYGDINVDDKDDVYFGYYSNTAQLWDNIAFNAPYYLMVKAAGNSRNMTEPAVGQPYYRYNPAIGNYELIAARSAEMRFYNGYDVIPDHSVAKNILTVGAIQAIINGYKQPSDAVIFSASSWGPTDDGRIKPDLVGNGIGVTSTMSSADDAYNRSTGTSMAAPNVSGSLFLLQEHYANRNNGKFMLAATLKGLAIHTANEAGNNPGPDYIYGWGVLNVEQAAKVISNSQQKHQLSENTLIQNQVYTQTVTASGSEPLRVTISWTDPAGTVLPMVPSTLNNRTPRLVNNLDVRVSNGQKTSLPWVLDPGNPSAAATTGDNIRDNVEQILISNPVPGETYTITVSHKGILKNSVQNYSMIISGLQGVPYCASGAISQTGARIEKVTLGQIENSSASECSTYTDYTALSANAEAGQAMPLSVVIGTCDAPANTVLKVFVDWNEDGDFNDAEELAATSAVMATTSTFNTTIKVPATVKSGNSARMRLVLAETDNAGTVSNCGTYGKGETEDYALNFTAPSRDLGIAGIITPNAGSFYTTPDQGVTLKIRNFGTTIQKEVPVSVSVTAGSKAIATLTGIYQGAISPGEEKSFTLPGSFNVAPSTTYTISATTLLTGDLILFNNEYISTLTSQALQAAPAASAFTCDNSAPVTLKGTVTTGTIFWYDALVNGNLLAVGNNTSTTVKPENNIYYAALNEFAGTTASLKNSATGSFSNSGQDTVYFNTKAPFLLDRATINAGAAGTVMVNLYSPQNGLIGSTQLNLTPGVAQYSLNLTVPAAGDKYRLLVTSFSGGATANLNEAAGTVLFPYNTNNLLTVTKSRTGGLNIYDWKIKASGNPSARAAVQINGAVTASATNVCAGKNAGIITFNSSSTVKNWEKSTDGITWTALAHTGSSYNFENIETSTHYRVIFTEGSCTIASQPVKIVVNTVPTAVISASGSTKLCEGNNVTLTASAGNSYLWSNGQTSRSITVSLSGNYSVLVTNESGCSATAPAISVTTCLTTWTGTTDTNWSNTANWTNGVPDEEMDVNIPANLKNYPAVTAGTVTCRNLTNLGSLTVTGSTINITENFTSTGSLYQNTNGLIQFTGISNHKIIGTTFQNLRIGGGGTKILSSDITVTGNLTIVDGIISTGNYKIMLDANATLTETATNYVVGKVMATRSFNNVATQTFGNMGLSLTTTAKPTPTIEVTRVTGITGPGSIRSVKRYFEIHVIAGKASDLNASMEFTYLPGEINGLTKDNLALYRSVDNGGTWNLRENSSTDKTAGTYKLSLNGISAFSTWTAADRDPNLVLPVSLVSFKVSKQKQDAVLTWETASEKNAHGMEVEVSTDAKSYRTLGFVAATGINTTTRQSYQFTDTETGKSGTRYYRLKQLDQDGKFTYYSPKAVSFNQQVVSDLTAYPNPSKGTFALSAQATETELMQLEIKNASGQTVYSAQKHLYKGENKLSINLPAGTKPGVYVVLARYNNGLHPLKLVVE